MPTASLIKFNSFVEAVAHGVHNLGSDQLTVALVAAANAPTAADENLGDLTEATYTNCSSRNITTDSSEQTGGVYKLTLNDLILTAGGGEVGPFRYIVIYNDDAASDELVAAFDYGEDVTLVDGETFTIDFSALNGLLQLS